MYLLSYNQLFQFSQIWFKEIDLTQKDKKKRHSTHIFKMEQPGAVTTH